MNNPTTNPDEGVKLKQIKEFFNNEFFNGLFKINGLSINGVGFNKMYGFFIKGNPIEFIDFLFLNIDLTNTKINITENLEKTGVFFNINFKDSYTLGSLETKEDIIDLIKSIIFLSVYYSLKEEPINNIKIPIDYNQTKSFMINLLNNMGHLNYLNGIKKNIGLFHEINIKINGLGLELEDNLFDLKNLSTIEKYKESNRVDLETINFLNSIIRYLIIGIAFNNLIKKGENLTDDEKYKGMFFSYALVYIGDNISKNIESVEKKLKESKVLHQLGDKYSKKLLDEFYNSFFYKNCDKDKLSIPLIKLIIDNKKIFLGRKVNFSNLLNLIITINNEENLENIRELLNRFKDNNLSEDILISCVNNILKSSNILNESNYSLFGKYLKLGYSLENLKKIGIEDLEYINKKNNNIEIINNCIKDKNYLETLKKTEFKELILSEIIYLNSCEEGVLEIYKILKNIENNSLQDLQIDILKIKIKYNLDEIIIYNKKILRNIKKEDLKIYLEYLEIFKNIFLNFKDKDNILEYIFIKDISFIKVIYYIIDFIIIDDDFMKINFISLKNYFDIIGNNRDYINNYLYKNSELINLYKLLEQIKNFNINTNLDRDLFSVFGSENIDIINDYLKDKNDSIKIIIINIGKNIQKDLITDFVLNLEDFNESNLKILEEIINLIKYYKINIEDFEIIKSLLKNYNKSKITFLNNHINNNFLISCNNKQDFLIKLIDFFKNGDEKIFKIYIDSINKKIEAVYFKNSLDNQVYNIYLNGTEEEKEKIIKKINILLRFLSFEMHPIHTTSTKNNNFGKGSGSYSYVIDNYIFKKLIQKGNETNNEYLERILKQNIVNLINVDSNEINGYFELMGVVNICNNCNNEKGIFHILETVKDVIQKISLLGDKIDLSKVGSLYKDVLEKGLKKF